MIPLTALVNTLNARSLAFGATPVNLDAEMSWTFSGVNQVELIADVPLTTTSNDTGHMGPMSVVVHRIVVRLQWAAIIWPAWITGSISSALD
jgi:hypothetical protein